MKKIYILTVGLTLFTSFLFSQNATLVLKGVMVSDGYNSPLEFATVVVNMPNSDEIVTGGITGEDGSFSTLGLDTVDEHVGRQETSVEMPAVVVRI